METKTKTCYFYKWNRPGLVIQIIVNPTENRQPNACLIATSMVWRQLYVVMLGLVLGHVGTFVRSFRAKGLAYKVKGLTENECFTIYVVLKPITTTTKCIS